MALTATHLPFCILYCSWIKYHLYISLQNCKMPQLYYILSRCPTVVFWGTALLGQSRLFLSLEWLLWDKLPRVGCLHRCALHLSMQLFVCLSFSLHCWHHCACRFYSFTVLSQTFTGITTAALFFFLHFCQFGSHRMTASQNAFICISQIVSRVHVFPPHVCLLLRFLFWELPPCVCALDLGLFHGSWRMQLEDELC